MIKLVILEDNKEKLKEHNELCEELKVSEPSINWEKQKLENINDEFHRYSSWLEELSDENIIIIEDTNKNLDNIYISNLNWEHDLERLTDYKLVNKYGEWTYGVCDNASQVLEYCDRQIIEEELSEDKEYIIVLTPILKRHQPKNDGWRWHKWGKYIGVQNPQYEYLADEDNIDMVYVFEVKEVTKISA
jgi:hypothetical protein